MVQRHRHLGFGPERTRFKGYRKADWSRKQDVKLYVYLFNKDTVIPLFDTTPSADF